MSTPARERSGFGQFQLNRSATGPGVNYSKIHKVSTGDMAELLRDGATIQEVAEAFGRGVSAIQQRLSTAGWSAVTGQPIDTFTKPEVKAPQPLTHLFIDQPWADQALCAQTDPEMFFPRSIRASWTPGGPPPPANLWTRSPSQKSRRHNH